MLLWVPGWVRGLGFALGEVTAAVTVCSVFWKSHASVRHVCLYFIGEDHEAPIDEGTCLQSLAEVDWSPGLWLLRPFLPSLG